MLSPKTKRNIGRIIPFGLIWLIFSIVYSLLERGLLGDLEVYPSTGNVYHFGITIFSTAITSTLLGLLIGTIEIRFLSKLFQQKSFIQKIGYKTIIYLVMIILFLWVISLVYNAVELKKGLFDKMVWDSVRAFFLSFAFWSVEIYIAAIICFSLFYAEVSENLGHGVLINFFTGKYHSPRQEERIFMFLDLKSSTTIAESIGHVKYFEMLREYFADMADPIIGHAGEIYQYVGDEIVVSWRVKNGLQNNNCVQCFFSIKSAIHKQSKKYNDKFGLLPEFKAGFHVGKVTTGEIGIIKREIIFTGDVLNTTARIQGLCNTFNVDNLISEDLMKKLDGRSEFQVKEWGQNALRGREEKIGLFSIQQRNP